MDISFYSQTNYHKLALQLTNAIQLNNKMTRIQVLNAIIKKKNVQNFQSE